MPLFLDLVLELTPALTRRDDKDIAFLLSLHPGPYLSRGFNTANKEPGVLSYDSVVAHVQKNRQVLPQEIVSTYQGVQEKCRELKSHYKTEKARVVDLYSEFLKPSEEPFLISSGIEA